VMNYNKYALYIKIGLILLLVSEGVYLNWDYPAMLTLAFFGLAILFPINSRLLLASGIIALIVSALFVIIKRELRAEEVANFSFALFLLGGIFSLLDGWRKK